MSDEYIHDESDRTIAELISSRSPIAAACWRLSECSRIVGYSVAFIGPSAIAVFWLFDALKSRFSHEQFQNEFKEWYFYGGTALALALVGWLAGRVSEQVQASLERHFARAPIAAATATWPREP